MNATPKKKLCWNCEGRVSLQEENCLYCGVYLGPAPGEEKNSGILPPPYRIVDAEEEDHVPASPYVSQEQKPEEEVEDLGEARKDVKQVVFPLLFLSAGSMFFLFGLFLLMFSDDGLFTLTWRGEYWYAYFLGALPLLFLGWRSLQRFEEEGLLESE